MSIPEKKLYEPWTEVFTIVSIIGYVVGIVLFFVIMFSRGFFESIIYGISCFVATWLWSILMNFIGPFIGILPMNAALERNDAKSQQIVERLARGRLPFLLLLAMGINTVGEFVIRIILCRLGVDSEG